MALDPNIDKVLKEFDPTTADPHNWTSINLGKLMPKGITEVNAANLAKYNAQIDTKQRQVDKLVDDTQNLLGQANVLTRDLKSLQKNVKDLLQNAFNTGAHYRIIGFDSAISNNGEAAREIRRVLSSQIFGPTGVGVSPDPNFPYFVGETARLGGFVMLWGAPSFNKIIEQFKKLGGYFPGIGDGILGAPTAFLKEAVKIPDFFKGLDPRAAALTKEWEKWKKSTDPKLFDLGAFGELVPDTDHWHSLSVSKLIPALDPLKAGSPANQALKGVDIAFESVQSLFSVITGAKDTVNKLGESIQSLQGLVNSMQGFTDDVIDTVFDTGLYFHAFNAEYGASTSEDLAGVIIKSLNNTEDPNRPTFEGSTAYIGGIIATIGAPDVNEFEKVFARFSNTWQSIGLAAESWGDSFDLLVSPVDPATDVNSKEKGINDIVTPDEDPTIPVVIDPEEYTSKILVSENLTVTALVPPFIIKDEDIPPVTANNSFEYTSANDITVKTEADSRGNIRVTIIETTNIITIKRNETTYIATNDSSKITSVVNPITSRVKNYISGEVIAREDGSIKETRGNLIIITYPDGLKTQIQEDRSGVTTRADGTEETTSADGSKIVKFLNGVIKYYDKEGNLVRTEAPEDIETNDEISKGLATILPDGSIEKKLANGIVEVTSADGKTVKTYYPDGRIQIEKEDGVIILITESAKTTNFTDGSKKIEVIEDGILTKEITFIASDGTQTSTNEYTGVQEIKTPDGTIIIIYPDGSSKTLKTDGTVRTVSAITDTIVEERPDGTTITTYEDGSIKQVNPDDTFTYVSREGEVTTGTEKGEVVVQNEDGSVSRVMSEGLIISRELDGTITKENETTGTTITVTPEKITTEEADGTIIETTDTTKVTTDDAGNKITVQTSVELGTETVEGVEREVAFKVTETITEFATGKTVVQTQKEPIYDEVVVVRNGKEKRIKIPAIRSGESRNVTTQSNFGESIEVHVDDNKGFTSIIKTEVKSGETTKEKVRTEVLKDRSIDKISEFEE